MKIYCDRLSLRSCLAVVRLLRSCESESGIIILEVLDPFPDNLWAKILQLTMKIFHLRVEEAEFTVSHLKMPDGQSVFFAARRSANEIAIRMAERMIQNSNLLRRLNHEWGRNTVLLHLAKSVWRPIEQLMLRLLVTDVLVRNSGEERALLIAKRPISFDSDLLPELNLALKVHLYYSGLRWFTREQAYGLLYLLRERFRKVKWSLENFLKGPVSHHPPNAIPPTILLLQEDDLSLDRSYRGQPHWLFPEDKPPSFRTLILSTYSVKRLSPAAEDLKRLSVFLVAPKDWRVFPRSHGLHPVQSRLNQEVQRCIFRAIFGKSSEIEGVSALIRLFYDAADLAAFCRGNNVKVFMTCENYMRWADSMLLIAPLMDIRTISYQYSNMGSVGPLMMTTVDSLITFSSLYHRRWGRNGVQPRTFVDAGYVFDGSFKYARERALMCREKLMKAGAEFILCYFDENVFSDKYSLVTVEDHIGELLFLLRHVIDDSSIGLVVKTQFYRNSPMNFKEIADVRKAAKSTGRYIELVHGSHRNIVFPAEAALSADMVIGHAVGSTASLEAALVGKRSILLNDYGMKSENDTLYAQADILYPSLTVAFEAIRNFIRGVPRCATLGDWSPIIHHFDPFRDGRSGERMRKLLEQSVLRGKGFS